MASLRDTLLRVRRRDFTGPDRDKHISVLERIERWANGIHLPALTDSADVSTAESRTLNTFADLATVGPDVAVPIGPSGRALVVVSASIDNAGAGKGFMSFQVLDGATEVVAPSDPDSAVHALTGEIRLARMCLVEGLAQKTHTFRARYRGNGAAATTFSGRRIVVFPL